MSEESPKILIIAGPNGAGKTTFAREYLPNEGNCSLFVNADLIAAGLSPFAPDLVAIRAGRIMLSEIAEHVSVAGHLKVHHPWSLQSAPLRTRFF